MISVRHLSIQLAATPLLSDLNFELDKGGFAALLGANGAGKSTLLRVLAGCKSPELSYQGEVFYDKIPLQALSLPELARQRAVMSQKVHLSFPISVLEVVLLGMGKQQAEKASEQAMALLDELNMGDFAHRQIQSLSGGEQQRVQLARALLQLESGNTEQAQLLLLDEPTASLDVRYQHQLLQLVKKYTQQKGITVLAVLHDLNMAAQYADQLLVLHDGQLLAKGNAIKTLQPGILKQAFGINAIVQQHPVVQCPQVVTY